MEMMHWNKKTQGFVCLSLGLKKPEDFTVSEGHGHPLVFLKGRPLGMNQLKRLDFKGQIQNEKVFLTRSSRRRLNLGGVHLSLVKVIA
jgi:hypothetical protein